MCKISLETQCYLSCKIVPFMLRFWRDWCTWIQIIIGRIPNEANDFNISFCAHFKYANCTINSNFTRRTFPLISLSSFRSFFFLLSSAFTFAINLQQCLSFVENCMWKLFWNSAQHFICIQTNNFHWVLNLNESIWCYWSSINLNTYFENNVCVKNVWHSKLRIRGGRSWFYRRATVTVGYSMKNRDINVSGIPINFAEGHTHTLGCITSEYVKHTGPILNRILSFALQCSIHLRKIETFEITKIFLL